MSYGQVAMAEPEYEVRSDQKQMKSSKKIKKPGFIKRWLLKSVKEAVQQERDAEVFGSNQAKVSRGLIAVSGHQQALDSSPMVLKIYRANGGTVVETTTYDRQKDRHGNQLHIIAHDVDLGEGLAKIITMESLRG